jgi:hypothetical protein
MDSSIIIPWQEFLDALRRQQSAQVQLWLRRWLFTNEGVILADQRIASVHGWRHENVGKKTTNAGSADAKHRCNHPLALVTDPTPRQLSGLAQMLVKC